jgi:hypothetical protein
MKPSLSETPLDLKGVQLPDVPAWFPLAWGWWASAIGVLIALLCVVWLYCWQRKRLAPKKTALRLIDQPHCNNPASAMEVVRQVVLSYYPRNEVAYLTGDDWYAFLDAEITQPLFVPNRDKWQQALYQKQSAEDEQQLVEHCQQWVREALPPKKRGK